MPAASTAVAAGAQAPSTWLYVASEGVRGDVPTLTGTLTAVRTANGKARYEAKVPALPSAVAVTPSGSAYVAGVGSDELGLPGSVTPVGASGAVGKPIKVASDAMGAVSTPNGKTVYVLSGTDAATQPPSTPGVLTPITTATDKVGTAIKVAPSPIGMAMSPNGATVYVMGQNSASEVATASGTVTTIRLAVDAAAISPTTNWAYFAVPSKLEIVPVNAPGHSIGPPIGTGTATPRALAISADGLYLYALGAPGAAIGNGASSSKGTASLTVISTRTHKGRHSRPPGFFSGR